ncbi:MAG TPA: YdeI/OmpD-associated family protein [Cyclobacteriaceae bacterium]|nr:YdeI/OmpD-associated family protein [Cyclobacteriaceae bacterium]
MISYNTTLLKFDKKGEKSGWTFIEISPAQAKKLSDSKVSFRVKGALDSHKISQVAILPMGDGGFILAVNGTMRKAIGKKAGDKVKVTLEADESKIILSRDLMACLKDDPAALAAFKKLPGSHQKYFSRWVESAKTANTKTKRIVMAVEALSKKMRFNEMLRAERDKRF